ncbi:hypothetical protein [Francisella frigiditurris]|uniref:Uncharacterized protein n=1 Tax=Francisella frigiditurris TaxID=1542390 RepID=A0A1J0KUR7_9GAMM|nr:hypothetical protein [Francisella frigiditurris]APC97372.1 hypothetical protein KX01_848 [Francisella frigiditurris]
MIDNKQEIYDIINFSSIDSVKESIEKGIDDFLDFFQIQKNKNVASLKASGALLRAKASLSFTQEQSDVHTNYLGSDEFNEATKLKAQLKRTIAEKDLESDNTKAIQAIGLEHFLSDLGRNLVDVGNSQGIGKKESIGRLNTVYASITLSIFHNSCVIVNPAPLSNQVTGPSHSEPRTITLNRDNTFYNLLDLLGLYFKPNTKNSEVLKKLYLIIGYGLMEINNYKKPGSSKDIFLKENNTINFKELSTTDRLAALIFENGLLTNTNTFDSFFSKEEVENFNKIAAAVKDINTQENVQNKPLSQEVTKNIETTYSELIDLYDKIDKITDAVNAYILKYKENTENPSASKNAREYAGEVAKDYATGVASTAATSALKAAITTCTLGTVTAAFPPATIASLSIGIAKKALEKLTESKSYGIFNRHGVTGQTRAFFIQHYLANLIHFFKNQYRYIFYELEKEIDVNTGMSIKDHRNSTPNFSKQPSGLFSRRSLNPVSIERRIEELCNFLKRTKKDFIDGYRNASTSFLPKRDKEAGELYFYLTMYADPTDKELRPNYEFINEWKSQKLRRTKKII